MEKKQEQKVDVNRKEIVKRMRTSWREKVQEQRLGINRKGYIDRWRENLMKGNLSPFGV